jgi:hypothetical protein
MHMIRSLFGVVCVIALATAQLGAQHPEYVPSYRLPEGKEIVAVYIGATTCGPCLLPEVKAAVRAMKTLVAAQAKQRNAAFSAVGVSNDWETPKAAAFFDSLGRFDQLVLGGNWTNLAIEHFVWRDPSGSPAMPQILVLERTVTPAERIQFSEPRVLRRVTGGDQIPAWVKDGAPISSVGQRP